MNNTNTVGVDLAKNTFHLCIQNSKGNILKKINGARLDWFSLKLFYFFIIMLLYFLH